MDGTRHLTKRFLKRARAEGHISLSEVSNARARIGDANNVERQSTHRPHSPKTTFPVCAHDLQMQTRSWRASLISRANPPLSSSPLQMRVSKTRRASRGPRSSSPTSRGDDDGESVTSSSPERNPSIGSSASDGKGPGQQQYTTRSGRMVTAARKGDEEYYRDDEHSDLEDEKMMMTKMREEDSDGEERFVVGPDFMDEDMMEDEDIEDEDDDHVYAAGHDDDIEAEANYDDAHGHNMTGLESDDERHYAYPRSHSHPHAHGKQPRAQLHKPVPGNHNHPRRAAVGLDAPRRASGSSSASASGMAGKGPSPPRWAPGVPADELDDKKDASDTLMSLRDKVPPPQDRPPHKHARMPVEDDLGDEEVPAVGLLLLVKGSCPTLAPPLPRPAHPQHPHQHQHQHQDLPPHGCMDNNPSGLASERAGGGAGDSSTAQSGQAQAGSGGLLPCACN
jgi:hypothetical protein